MKKESQLTQREMTQKMGVSLGKINYCISELSQKGMIKVERFQKSKNKSAYIYRLTPSGLEEVSTLTVSFLKNKIREYDRIKMEIKSLVGQVREMDSELAAVPDLLEALKDKS